MNSSLVDAHAVIWALDRPFRLTPAARSVLQNTTVKLFISAATIWEIAIKVAIGKLTLSAPYRQWINRAILDLDLTILPITLDHCEVQSALPMIHNDPFDRLIASQSLFENFPVVSSDVIFDAYGVARIW